MVRGQDLLFAHHGSSNEDNATKNLCWLLNHLPFDVSADLLRPFVSVFDQGALLDALGPDDIEVVAQESAKVSDKRPGEKLLLGLASGTHSYTDTGVDEFYPDKDATTTDSRPDLTIQFGDKLVIAIEAKDGDFSHRQLENHARWLDAERFETVTWKRIADQFGSVHRSRLDSDRELTGISGTSLPTSAVQLLLTEYEKILTNQLIERSRTLASSGYTTGTNYVRANSQVGPDKLTGRVTDDDNRSPIVPVAISFRASGEQTDGQRLWFTRDEWVSLLKSIEVPEYHRQLARGELSSIIADYNSADNGDITIAHIEDSDGNEKAMFYGTGKGDRTTPLLYLNRSTAAGGPLTRPPMYNADEFDRLLADGTRIRRLFTNPEAVFDELKQDI
jgi:hypothetical protein